jgi:RNA polymerase sigma factor (sigma-70 family)
VDRSELDGVLAEHGALLTRIAASYEARPSQRQDLLQEIALAIWRALPTFRQEAPLRSFVARIAHNRGVSHVIAQKRDHHLAELGEGLPDPGGGPEQETGREQRRQRLLTAVRRLPIGLRQVVTLALEGFSHAEIGEVLGITANNVDVRLSRARTALRRELGQADG